MIGQFAGNFVWVLNLLISFSSFSQDKYPIEVGIGVVAIADTYDQTKVLQIYKDKGLSVKLIDFKLYGNLKIVNPFYYKPDYGVCYFICLEKQKNCYRILINDSMEAFLPNTNDNYFKSWESVLTNYSVERLDLKTNPLKEKPNAASKTIELSYTIKIDRLEVIEVIEAKSENWVKVNYSKSGQVPCTKGTEDCGEGWIKWKDGNKLLVNVLLLD